MNNQIVCGYCKAKAVTVGAASADDYLWILPVDSPLRKLEVDALNLNIAFTAILEEYKRSGNIDSLIDFLLRQAVDVDKLPT